MQRQSGTSTVDKVGEWRLLASALRPTDATLADYQRLSEALRDAGQRDGVTAQELAEAVERVSPKFHALAD